MPGCCGSWEVFQSQEPLKHLHDQERQENESERNKRIHFQKCFWEEYVKKRLWIITAFQRWTNESGTVWFRINQHNWWTSSDLNTSMCWYSKRLNFTERREKLTERKTKDLIKINKCRNIWRFTASAFSNVCVFNCFALSSLNVYKITLWRIKNASIQMLQTLVKICRL